MVISVIQFAEDRSVTRLVNCFQFEIHSRIQTLNCCPITDLFLSDYFVFNLAVN